MRNFLTSLFNNLIEENSHQNNPISNNEIGDIKDIPEAHISDIPPQFASVANALANKKKFDR